MANNDRKQLSKFVAPRWGAISYVLFFYRYSPPTEVRHKKVPRTDFCKVENQFIVKQKFVLSMIQFLKWHLPVSLFPLPQQLPVRLLQNARC